MFDPDSDSSFAATNQPSKNYVKFYRQWVRNNFKSNAEGREIGEERDFILIISPGQSKTEVRRQATEADKLAYAGEYAAYKAGKEMQVQGTPIEMLPGLANGMADALKAQYIFTIEQMADLSDMGLQKVGMGGNEIRQRAKAYLTGGTAELTAAKSEIAALRSELEEARRVIAELRQAKPRGRKPKAEPAVLS